MTIPNHKNPIARRLVELADALQVYVDENQRNALEMIAAEIRYLAETQHLEAMIEDRDRRLLSAAAKLAALCGPPESQAS